MEDEKEIIESIGVDEPFQRPLHLGRFTPLTVRSRTEEEALREKHAKRYKLDVGKDYIRIELWRKTIFNEEYIYEEVWIIESKDKTYRVYATKAGSPSRRIDTLHFQEYEGRNEGRKYKNVGTALHLSTHRLGVEQ